MLGTYLPLPHPTHQQYRVTGSSEVIMRPAPTPQIAPIGTTEAELVQRARNRDEAAIRGIMQSNNRRLYRIARGILRNDSEAEDVVQETYVRAFTHLQDFRGDSSLATWLARIAMNEALGRLRRQRPGIEWTSLPPGTLEAQVIQFPLSAISEDPEKSKPAPQATDAAAEGLNFFATELDNLASLYQAQGRYADAEPLYQRSLVITEKALGSNHPDVATTLNNLAETYRNQGRYADAEPLYTRSLAIREVVLGHNHPNVAITLNNMGLLYDNQARYADAEPLYQRSLAIREKALGPDDPDVAQALNNLAANYSEQGYYADAEPLYKRSLAIREKALGLDHPDVAQSLNNLAAVYEKQGRFADAEPLYKRSLAIDEKALGPDHPTVANSLNNLAELYETQGRYGDAEPAGEPRPELFNFERTPVANTV
jgi:RNA polymerase sigma factor (sigma-70 family)